MLHVYSLVKFREVLVTISCKLTTDIVENTLRGRERVLPVANLLGDIFWQHIHEHHVTACIRKSRAVLAPQMHPFSYPYPEPFLAGTFGESMKSPEAGQCYLCGTTFILEEEVAPKL